MEHFVVNIGRQLGSGGREIGERLAQRLNISFYDKELIQLASEESGLCREFFEKLTNVRHRALWAVCSACVFRLLAMVPFLPTTV